MTRQTLPNHSITVFTGNLSTSKALFLKLENALLLAGENEIVEVVSQVENLEKDLKGWCKLKGHILVDKEPLKEQFSYKILKQSRRTFPRDAAWGKRLGDKPLLKDLELTDSIETKAPDLQGLMARGIVPEFGSPQYDFALSHKEQIWSEPVARLYEEAKEYQWNATSDIPWNEIPDLDPVMERAVCQIMTYLVENEFSALYIPGKFISQMNPYYMEVPMFLSSLMNDEARHIEVFTKRANANGGGFGYSSAVTQRSLYSLFNQPDYLQTSFLLHVMGEGTFIDLLHFLEEHLPDQATKKIVNLARRDETRHVAYGIVHVKSAITQNPGKINALKNTAFRRKEFMDEASGESSMLLESLAILAGGGDAPEQYQRGFELVEELKRKMDRNRIKRLIEIGMDEDLAIDISKAHTPNFM